MPGTFKAFSRLPLFKGGFYSWRGGSSAYHIALSRGPCNVGNCPRTEGGTELPFLVPGQPYASSPERCLQAFLQSLSGTQRLRPCPQGCGHGTPGWLVENQSLRIRKWTIAWQAVDNFSSIRTRCLWVKWDPLCGGISLQGESRTHTVMAKRSDPASLPSPA